MIVKSVLLPPILDGMRNVRDNHFSITNMIHMNYYGLEVLWYKYIYIKLFIKYIAIIII